jgi:hypothetical protein
VETTRSQPCRKELIDGGADPLSTMAGVPLIASATMVMSPYAARLSGDLSADVTNLGPRL